MRFPRTLGARAIGSLVELALDFLHQQLMIPADAIALDEVPSAIECVGLGRVVTDAEPLIVS